MSCQGETQLAALYTHVKCCAGIIHCGIGRAWTVHKQWDRNGAGADHNPRSRRRFGRAGGKRAGVASRVTRSLAPTAATVIIRPAVNRGGIVRLGPRSTGGADINGDGAAELAVFRPATGEWWVRDAAAAACGDDPYLLGCGRGSASADETHLPGNNQQDDHDDREH